MRWPPSARTGTAVAWSALAPGAFRVGLYLTGYGDEDLVWAARAHELLLTGRIFDAAEAHTMVLVLDMVDDGVAVSVLTGTGPQPLFDDRMEARPLYVRDFCDTQSGVRAVPLTIRGDTFCAGPYLAPRASSPAARRSCPTATSVTRRPLWSRQTTGHPMVVHQAQTRALNPLGVGADAGEGIEDSPERRPAP
ncbi:hypothetical protein SAMN04489712_13116 [Thermomonospora echinospora]|uniref:Uncharacterized protein n=1 Tax=Thermomonospora echinospora TaxID=1992 RepID=A0A1H6E3N0_9ACTN|nr:hypothetical protein [Thermomonospora echinospora]SEG91889.1 hypothetical protein SAMN04489712_13116 [Thermomonospora echinospora]